MAVADLPGVEIYHVADNGRIVALAEGDGEHVGYALTQMQSLPGVIAANMVYHGMDDSEDNSRAGDGVISGGGCGWICFDGGETTLSLSICLTSDTSYSTSSQVSMLVAVAEQKVAGL